MYDIVMRNGQRRIIHNILARTEHNNSYRYLVHGNRYNKVEVGLRRSMLSWIIFFYILLA